jgi:arabinogalactan endo-1,4-beta-galactosidase
MRHTLPTRGTGAPSMAMAMATLWLATVCGCGGGDTGAAAQDGGGTPVGDASVGDGGRNGDSGTAGDASLRGDGGGDAAMADASPPGDAFVDAPVGGNEFDAPFFLGADISSTQQAEANGATFADEGVAEPILTLLKNHGFNYVRLRTFVDPTQPAPNPAGGTFPPYSTQGFCDLAHTITFGQQIKAAQMGFLLDFHYSDYWADPGKQIKPAAWVNDDLPAAVTHLHDYTYGAIQALVAAGARPDMVQIGNEITPGILLSPGTPLGPRTTAGWPALAQLLNAGIQAVHQVDPTIKIMLHLDRGGDLGGPDGGSAGEALANSIDFVDNAVANGVAFDVLGESCYVTYQGPPASWQDTFDGLVAKYPTLQFVMAEYNADPADQTDDELTQANDIVFNLPNHQGVGAFFWEPTEYINQANQGMFTENGSVYSPIPACISQYDQMESDYGL